MWHSPTYTAAMLLLQREEFITVCLISLAKVFSLTHRSTASAPISGQRLLTIFPAVRLVEFLQPELEL